MIVELIYRDGQARVRMEAQSEPEKLILQQVSQLPRLVMEHIEEYAPYQTWLESRRRPESITITMLPPLIVDPPLVKPEL